MTSGSPELYNTGTITGGKGSGVGIEAGSNVYIYNKGGTITVGADFVIPEESNVAGGAGVNLSMGSLLKDSGGEISAGATTGTPDTGNAVGGIPNGATVELYGGATISGTNGAGLAIYAIDGSTVNIAPGTVLDGAVEGRFGTNTLNLTGSTGQRGTLIGYGTNITGFGGLTFDGSATWTVDTDSETASGPNGFGEPTFTGFGTSDTIDVTDFKFNNNITKSFSGDTLELSNGTGNIYVDFPGFTSAGQFSITSDGGNGTDINAACYRGGTRLRTVGGDVPIEKLVSAIG